MRLTATRAMAALSLLALAHAPAMAQDEGGASEVLTEAMVEAVEETVEEAGEEDGRTGFQLGGPGPSAILLAPSRFLGTYGEGWLEADAEVCLEQGEVVVLAPSEARIASVELRGPLCTIVGDAPEVATIVVELPAAGSRPRSGATRGVAPARASRSPTPRSPSFRVAAGSDAVLARYPRGTRVVESAEICLERGEQVTLISSAGQRVTYRGPGCARRNVEPSGRNVGGFTFGWNGWSDPRTGERS